MRYLAAVLAVLIGASPGHAEMPASFVQMLQQTTLTRDVIVQNSPDVYANLPKLRDQAGLFTNEAKDISLAELNLAWIAHPQGDAKTQTITLRKGMSLYQVIEEIARARGEIVIDQTCNCVVIGLAGSKKYFREVSKAGAHEDDLAKLMQAVIPPGITNLSNINGGVLEDFIDAKFKESLSYDKNPAVGLYTLKIEPDAKGEIVKVSVMGSWLYGELMDTYCDLLDLRWRIDGNTLRLEKPTRDSSK